MPTAYRASNSFVTSIYPNDDRADPWWFTFIPYGCINGLLLGVIHSRGEGRSDLYNNFQHNGDNRRVLNQRAVELSHAEYDRCAAG